MLYSQVWWYGGGILGPCTSDGGDISGLWRCGAQLWCTFEPVHQSTQALCIRRTDAQVFTKGNGLCLLGELAGM